MHDRARRIKVGLFVIACSLLFVALMALSIGSTLWKRTTTYRIHYHETIKGMVVGSAVNFQGVTIGAVSDMRFFEGVTEVVVEVDPRKAPIQAATRASLDRAWVTGQVTVELSGWERGAPILPENAIIRSDLSLAARVVKTLPETLGPLVEMLEEYKGVGTKLNEMLRPELSASLLDVLDGSKRVLARVDREMLPRVEKLVDELGSLTPGVRQNLTQLAKLTERLQQVAGDPKVDALLTESHELAKGLSRTAASFSRVGDEMTHILRGNSRDLGNALAQFAEAFKEVQGVMRILQASPSALVFGNERPERRLPATSGHDTSRMPPVRDAAAGGKQ